jgi:hypothetical protein
MCKMVLWSCCASLLVRFHQIQPAGAVRLALQQTKQQIDRICRKSSYSNTVYGVRNTNWPTPVLADAGGQYSAWQVLVFFRLRIWCTRAASCWGWGVGRPNEAVPPALGGGNDSNANAEASGQPRTAAAAEAATSFASGGSTAFVAGALAALTVSRLL